MAKKRTQAAARLKLAKRISPRLTPAWRDLISRRQPLASLYELSPLERVEQVRAGVPAQLIDLLSEEMDLSKETLYATLRLPGATVKRKLQKQEPLSPDESERVLGIARLIGQVESTVRESGNPNGFDAAKWVAAWLAAPHAALGGKRPAELMDTADGRALVVSLIAQMQSGAYA